MTKDWRSAWHATWLILVGALWLIPLYHTGTKQGRVPWLPRRVTLQHAAAGLFTDREGSWNQIAFLVRTESNKEWIEVDRRRLSQTQLAGYRNRLDRLVPMVRRSRMANEVWRRLGEDVAARCAAAHPESGPVTAVRIVNTNWPTNLPEMTHPKGHWQIPPVAEVAPERIRILTTVAFAGGTALPVSDPAALRASTAAGPQSSRQSPPRSAPPRRLRPYSAPSTLNVPPGVPLRNDSAPK